MLNQRSFITFATTEMACPAIYFGTDTDGSTAVHRALDIAENPAMDYRFIFIVHVIVEAMKQSPEMITVWFHDELMPERDVDRVAEHEGLLEGLGR
jgi:hypothetical protein